MSRSGSFATVLSFVTALLAGPLRAQCGLEATTGGPPWIAITATNSIEVVPGAF